MKIEKAIEVLKMDNELMQFDPNTGEDYPIELQNQDNQDLYNANLVAISALEKQLNSGWIPVSEKMPDSNKKVIVYAKGKCRNGDLYTVGSCHNGFWFLPTSSDTLGFTFTQHDVIAWQPLPPAYKEVENE